MKFFLSLETIWEVSSKLNYFLQTDSGFVSYILFKKVKTNKPIFWNFFILLKDIVLSMSIRKTEDRLTIPNLVTSKLIFRSKYKTYFFVSFRKNYTQVITYLVYVTNYFLTIYINYIIIIIMPKTYVFNECIYMKNSKVKQI